MNSPLGQGGGNANAMSDADLVTSQVTGATLNTDKSTQPSDGPEKDAGKDYIGSFPDNKGIGATGVRDITTSDEANARAAQLGGDSDVADTES